MQKRLNILRLFCNNLGVITLFIYTLLFLIGTMNRFLMTRAILATTALILYSIKCGAEIVNNDDEYIKSSIILVVVCLFNIIVSIILLSL